jgi:glutamine transport system substrate-binding protein
VGLIPDRPPLAYRSADKFVGLETDIARLAGANLGARVELAQLSPRALAPSLESGDVDAVMGDLALLASATPALRLTQPYLRTGQFVAIRTADLAVFQGPDAATDSGARVGYVRGSPGEDYARDHLVGSNAYGFDDGDAAIRSLRSHRIDFFVHQGPELFFLTSSAPRGDLLVLPRALSEREFGFAVANRNAGLAEELNGFLDRAMADGSLEGILDRWLRGPAPRGD